MNPALARDGVVPDALFAAVAELVRSRTGLTFSATSRDRLCTAIAAALRDDASAGTDDFLARLGADPARVMAIAAATTVAESYFFRHAGQFDWLRRDVLPALCARGREAPVRVWSAGCAAGEEPYSVAILLREMGVCTANVVIGSDLAPAPLARARAAVYSRWALRDVPPYIVARWFRRDGDEFTLDPSVRGAVTFVRHNLATDVFPPSAGGIMDADLILCRNVLIYFDRPTAARVAERLLAALSPDGWLLLGASDPPIAELTPCEVVVTDAGLAYRRAGMSGVRGARVIDLRAAVVDEPIDDRSWAPYAAPAEDVAVMIEHAPGASDPEPPTVPRRVRERYASRDYHGAVAAAERMLRAEPRAEFAWVTLVRSLMNLGDMQPAGVAGAIALERCPLSAELSYLAAIVHAHAGRDADAAVAARRAIYLDHTLVVAHVALGTALARANDRDGAVRAFENAARLLAGMRADTVVAAADGETAGAILALIGAQRALIAGRTDAR